MTENEEKRKRTYVHGNILELTYQLRRQVGVIRNVGVNFLVSGGCYLQIDHILHCIWN